MPRSKNPFAIRITDEQRQALGQWFANEVLNAQAARSSQELEVDYWHSQYEQARTRSADNLPWPDAADLTSYIPCEKVDSVHARVMRTIWTDPLCTVQGWGTAAERAPYVEEFHQFEVEEEGLQSVLDRLSLTALIEPRAVLEISESSETRTNRKQLTAKVQPNQEGGLSFDDKGQPIAQQKADGSFEEATSQDAGVDMVVDDTEVVRMGPQYRVLGYADSLIFPEYARDKAEVWGYGKRFYRRLVELKRLAKQGIYDVPTVESLTKDGDKEQTPSLSRSNQAIAPQDQATATKELWELTVLVDLNAILDSVNQQPISDRTVDGERWYVLTVHVGDNKLLRLDHDDFAKGRYVPVILFPRPDRVTEGFSFVGHKLITVTEEHTAYRNMAADRSSMAVNAPILKLQGALWDEDDQPWGPKQVITVRDPREIAPMSVPDVPASVFAQMDRSERTADRLSGVNDIASGQTVQADKTLGEIRMATEQSFVRMDLVVRRFQEALEDIMEVRHAIWKRVLAERQDGMDLPPTMQVGLTSRGLDVQNLLPNGKVTAALFDGVFRFKPFGSVETSDMASQRNDLVGMMQALPMMLQAFPSLQPMLASPRAARAMFRQFLRVFRVTDQQAFLGSPMQDMGQQLMLDQLPPIPAVPPPPMPPQMGAGGPPPGAHPMVPPGAMPNSQQPPPVH